MNCSRCEKHAFIQLTSILNKDVICLSCKAEERQHPLYADAQQEEHRAESEGAAFLGMFPDKSWEQIRKMTPVAQT